MAKVNAKAFLAAYEAAASPSSSSYQSRTVQQNKRKKKEHEREPFPCGVRGSCTATAGTKQNCAEHGIRERQPFRAGRREMRENARQFNPYAPNYGQYTAEDFGYKTGQQTVEPTVTAQTPRQRAESAVSIKEQTERNSRELLLKNAWKKSQNAL